MIKHPKQTTHLLVTSVCLLSALFTLSAFASNFAQKVQEIESLAYADVNENKLTDALQKLIELFRSVPDNDIRNADLLLGPLHLYSFIISEFYRPEFLYKGKLLQENQYSSDKLLMVVALLNNSITRENMALPIVTMLDELKRDNNLTIKFLAEVVSVYALTSEEGQKVQKEMIPELGREMNNLFVSLFLEHYASSIASQLVLQDLLNRGIEKVISEHKTYDVKKLVKTYIEAPEKLDLLSGFSNIGISPQELKVLLSGYDKIASVLPSMSFYDVNKQVIKEWADMLKYEKDINTRYTLITFLKCGTVLDKDSIELVKATLKEASQKKELTPDVMYAKVTLLEFAMKNYWIKEAEESFMDISQLEVLSPIHGIKSVYTQQKRLIEKGSEYFVKLGYYGIAKRALEIIALKYNSNFQLGVKGNLKKLETTPREYALQLINLDMARPHMRGNPDLIRKYFDEIIEHAGDPNLKNILATHDVTKPLKYNIDHATVASDAFFDMVNDLIRKQNANKAQP